MPVLFSLSFCSGSVNNYSTDSTKKVLDEVSEGKLVRSSHKMFFSPAHPLPPSRCSQPVLSHGVTGVGFSLLRGWCSFL